jgi:hypothetical protein
MSLFELELEKEAKKPMDFSHPHMTKKPFQRSCEHGQWV